jgi:hypothetical protein
MRGNLQVEVRTNEQLAVFCRAVENHSLEVQGGLEVLFTIVFVVGSHLSADAATAVPCTAQHSAAQHSTAQHSIAQHNTAQHRDSMEKAAVMA